MTLQLLICLLSSNKSHTISKVSGKTTQKPTCSKPSATKAGRPGCAAGGSERKVGGRQHEENSPLEERKCLLGAVKPLVPCTFTAATRNWYQRLARVSGSRTRSSVVWGENVTLTLLVPTRSPAICCATPIGLAEHTTASQPPHLSPAITLHCKAFTAVSKMIKPSNFTVHCGFLLEKVAFRK